MDFIDYIRDIEDFPERGIIFKDITPLLLDGNVLKEATKALHCLVGDSGSIRH